MLAYIGPGPGLELLPQFLALLGFAGMALLGVLLWPITALRRLLRRTQQQATTVLAGPTVAETVPSLPREAV